MRVQSNPPRRINRFGLNENENEDLMEEDKDHKNWNWAYAGVIGALVALMVFFYFFTQHFS